VSSGNPAWTRRELSALFKRWRTEWKDDKFGPDKFGPDNFLDV
jgi:hypothetical protein